MPTQTIWVEPELFLEHGGVRVFCTYKGDDIDQGANPFWFTLNSECGVEAPRCAGDSCPHVFDVRELSTWQPPRQPPSCTRANRAPERQAAWERYWAEEEAAIRTAIATAIERGELPPKVPPAPPPS